MVNGDKLNKKQKAALFRFQVMRQNWPYEEKLKKIEDYEKRISRS